jgi:hypothetical protein
MVTRRHGEGYGEICFDLLRCPAPVSLLFHCCETDFPPYLGGFWGSVSLFWAFAGVCSR